MWWSARTEDEDVLRSRVLGLLETYRSREPGALVRGVGAGAASLPVAPAQPSSRPFSAGGVLGRSAPVSVGWAPLLLVDDRALPPITATRIRYADVTRLDSDPLRDWGLDGDVLIEPVGPVVPAVAIGAELNAAGIATVGLPVISTFAGPPVDAFLTVAHGVGTVGSSVNVGLVSGGYGTGTVQYRDESARNVPGGGDDIALVALDPGTSVHGWLTNSGTHRPAAGPPYPIEPVDLYGSQSGAVLAQVTAVMLQMGDTTWQWLDCWELGATSPGMQRGDSGSLAIEPGPNPAVFGHFVGGAPALRGTGFSHHWVQDLDQVLLRHPPLATTIGY